MYNVVRTWLARTHARLTASASTSSGRDNSWPSGPVIPAANNFLQFCFIKKKKNTLVSSVFNEFKYAWEYMIREVLIIHPQKYRFEPEI